MAQRVRTRFTTREAMYYLRARPQFNEFSDQYLSDLIASVVTASDNKDLSLLSLAQIENELCQDPFSAMA
ncbi:hypothetical protein [Echinimonas agarilytica]|uniref:Uncharacterized protein n=1 Tax=Echinimonas agarilytica TaxID=1215918 RepID=A0AA41W3S8_9GAMM|nr:hypothetical protein [Echinimonas agarilytica]MCM2678282.1 hypothetical protein [Echinimonas agarilytica]